MSSLQRPENTRPFNGLRYADTHCHLDFSAFDRDREALMAVLPEVGVERLVVPGTRLEQAPALRALARQYPVQIAAAIGVHPLFLKAGEQVEANQLLATVEGFGSTLIALGETGLDGRSVAPPMAQQERAFRAHLQAAQILSLPVIVHAVRAHAEVLRILRDYPSVIAVIHAFSGSVEIARAYVDRGAYLGVGGVISRPTAHKTRAALRSIPLERLLLETDSPDMSPFWRPMGGQRYRNTPLSVPGIARELAKVVNKPLGELAAICWRNTSQAFPDLFEGTAEL